MVEDNVSGQTRYKCLVAGCKKRGRIIGDMSGIKLTYCANHRSYGVRILDFFIDSILRNRLSGLLEEARRDMFVENKPDICKDCNKKIAEYVKTLTTRISEIERIEKLRDLKV